VPLIYTVDKTAIWTAYQIDNGRNVTVSGNTTITLSDGNHNMTVYAADADYNNGASKTVFFSNFAVDTVPINVQVSTIRNTTYTSNDVPLSFTVDKSVSWAAYSLDGQANTTLSQNTTLTGLSLGSHTLTVYAQDTLGLVEASDPISFVVATNTIPEFQPWTILLSLALLLIATGLFVHYKKTKQA
jgi:hypothetical protein